MPKNRNHQGKGNASSRRESTRHSTTRSRRGRERHLSVRGELRDKPDVQKIARAVIAMAMAQAEADAQAAVDSTTEEASSDRNDSEVSE